MMLVTMAGCMQQDTKTIKTEAPYGAWASPLTAARATAGALRLGEIALDGDDVYWLEGRASEGGRNVLVRASTGAPPVDVTRRRASTSARASTSTAARPTPCTGATSTASNFADQRLYGITPGRPPRRAHARGLLLRAVRAWTPPAAALVCVREDQRKGDAEPPAAIVAVDVPLGRATGRRAGVVLVQGADFYSDAIAQPDGAAPGVAAVAPSEHAVGRHGALRRRPRRRRPPARRCGSPAAPTSRCSSREWSPDGVLYFVSDRTGWWNLYRHRGGRRPGRCIRSRRSSASRSGPARWLDLRVRRPRTASSSPTCRTGVAAGAASRPSRGAWSRWRRRLDLLDAVVADEPRRSTSSAARPPSRAGGHADVAGARWSRRSLQAARRSDATRRSTGIVSTPEAVTFDSAGRLRRVHAFYYPPREPRISRAGRDHAAAAGAEPWRAHRRPPKRCSIPKCSSGPAAASRCSTSTTAAARGYGRAYRERLERPVGHRRRRATR